ncbi:arabinofuranosidase catalytic domain-containing protein [Flavobacterium granuli]|uniref:Alpha-L-arabinofuranosidase B catalytic domain-containing protein n=1 Tax=Flavobacterium granuli TaxID=280093 RepID=A0ABU1S0D5_9FLAO|nr:hypothetical protein [Flavobacterium granuli]MDR6844495.1 hypothetical protein [Flavobacterium granuli]
MKRRYDFGRIKYRYLDGTGASNIVFSLRKAYTFYSGNCIRVRRSSDNTELDIGFLGYKLDSASLLSFVGSGNGYVRTWYDQSGNGNNAVQTVLASQPIIVESGVLNVELGLPTIKFTTAHTMTLPIFVLNQFSIFLTVSTKTGSPNLGGVMAIFPTTGYGAMVSGASGDATSHIVRIKNHIGITGFGNSAKGAYLPPKPLFRISFHNNGSSDVNNSSNTSFSGQTEAVYQNPLTVNTANWTGSYSVGIGRLNHGHNGTTYNMNLSEVIVFNFDNRSNNTPIMNNIKSFYKVA